MLLMLLVVTGFLSVAVTGFADGADLGAGFLLFGAGFDFGFGTAVGAVCFGCTWGFTAGFFAGAALVTGFLVEAFAAALPGIGLPAGDLAAAFLPAAGLALPAGFALVARAGLAAALAGVADFALGLTFAATLTVVFALAFGLAADLGFGLPADLVFALALGAADFFVAISDSLPVLINAMNETLLPSVEE
ncbi:MAG: hypothetical protein ACO3PV_07205 [Pseudohongiellaceae bacterium]